MAEILGKLKRETYMDHKVASDRDDKRMKVTVGHFKDHSWAEIRDHVRVPQDVGDRGVWRPSSGILIPMDKVTAVRKALQAIELEHGLVDADGAQEEQTNGED